MENNVVPVNKETINGIEVLRDNEGRFLKGTQHSTHVCGRKPMPKAFKELAQAHSIEALQTTIDIMNNPNAKPANRLKAVEIILNRAWGLPTVHLDGGIDTEGNNKPITIETIVGMMAKR